MRYKHRLAVEEVQIPNSDVVKVDVNTHLGFDSCGRSHGVNEELPDLAAAFEVVHSSGRLARYWYVANGPR